MPNLIIGIRETRFQEPLSEELKRARERAEASDADEEESDEDEEGSDEDEMPLVAAADNGAEAVEREVS
jgi:hypothetical protein